MSKEKQIEEMAEIMRHSCEKECRRNKYGEFDCEYCEAELLYNAGYRKQSEAEWISVAERLPDENGRFLTVDEKGDMMVCYWEEHFGWFAMVCNKNAITHWMPLPEPPDMKGGAE